MCWAEGCELEGWCDVCGGCRTHCTCLCPGPGCQESKGCLICGRCPVDCDCSPMSTRPGLFPSIGARAKLFSARLRELRPLRAKTWVRGDEQLLVLNRTLYLVRESGRALAVRHSNDLLITHYAHNLVGRAVDSITTPEARLLLLFYDLISEGTVVLKGVGWHTEPEGSAPENAHATVLVGDLIVRPRDGRFKFVCNPGVRVVDCGMVPMRSGLPLDSPRLSSDTWLCSAIGSLDRDVSVYTRHCARSSGTERALMRSAYDRSTAAGASFEVIPLRVDGVHAPLFALQACADDPDLTHLAVDTTFLGLSEGTALDRFVAGLSPGLAWAKCGEAGCHRAGGISYVPRRMVAWPPPDQDCGAARRYLPPQFAWIHDRAFARAAATLLRGPCSRPPPDWMLIAERTKVHVTDILKWLTRCKDAVATAPGADCYIIRPPGYTRSQPVMAAKACDARHVIGTMVFMHHGRLVDYFGRPVRASGDGTVGHLSLDSGDGLSEIGSFTSYALDHN